MPLKKLDDDKTWSHKICRSPEHNPPSMMVYPPGRYEWTCPVCGASTFFSVPLVTCSPVEAARRRCERRDFEDACAGASWSRARERRLMPF